MGRPATILEASPTTWWLVGVITAIVKAKLAIRTAVLGAAPCAATVFPKYPHVEGREAVVLEVEGAPPAQPPPAGKCLPAMGQGHVAGGGDLDPSP